MKQYFLGVIAIVLAVTFSAFTMHKDVSQAKNPNFSTAFFHLTTSSMSDENDLSKWAYDGSSPITCSGPATVLCSISAPVNASNQIDASQLSSPINLRADANVTNRQFKP
ncbi:MAG: hypothetical protein J7502_17135 [Flavisolibacter sp.]|nr:hypothetical protein [Flavisolibacter sp.]